MLATEELARLFEYDPYTDDRHWTEFTFVDFSRPKWSMSNAERSNDCLTKSVLNKDEISRLSRDAAMKQLRKERGHSVTEAEIKAEQAFFRRHLGKTVVDGLDAAVISRSDKTLGER